MVPMMNSLEDCLGYLIKILENYLYMYMYMYIYSLVQFVW